MITRNAGLYVSRRTALTAMGTGGLGVALTANNRSVVAHDSRDAASHVAVGTWLAGQTLDKISPVIISSDGTLTNSGPTVSVGQGGAIAFNTPPLGVWEPIDDRLIHITFIELDFDATGAPVGTFTVDGFPQFSEDGESFLDIGDMAYFTVRDTTGGNAQKTMAVDAGFIAVKGVRVRPGKPGFDELVALFASQESATPTS